MIPQFPIYIIQQPVIEKTFLGLGAEGWSVIATIFTGLAAIVAASIVISVTRFKEKRIEKNYIIRIARLLKDLDSCLALNLKATRNHNVTNPFVFTSISDDVIAIIKQILEYMSNINDRIDPRLYSDMEVSMSYVSMIYHDPTEFISACSISATAKKISLGEMETMTLEARRQEIKRFLIKLHMKEFCSEN